ncbi:hypothetical protein [Streptomyces griseorubiginosus]|uniref:hypothetical protein n=1 Tax=Streptomyces griseorubiginosus TaxID=67304 RepID=UPI00076CF753|nr:hypothetical protein [Streptomyces griseorubiginosus]KUM67420.1 hypothetical protein AQI84_40350 [Streptomyces griseorubiginosus]
MVTQPGDQGRDVVENAGADRPLLGERWRALSRRAQVTIAVSSGAVALGAVLGYVAATRPPPPPPDPVAATTVRITGVQMPQGSSLDFGVTIRIASASASAVTLTGSRQGYDGFLQTRPVPVAVLPPGRALVLHTRLNVYCQLPLPPPGTPLLFVTMRNDRREGRAPVVPTAAQTAAIDDAVQRICVH